MKLVYIGAIALVIVLAACQPEWATDQCLRERLFKECIQAADGKPGDFAETVNECDITAVYQARRSTENVSPECR